MKKVWYLRAKDDIVEAIVIKETKTTVVLETADGIQKKLAKASAHETYEKAVEANKRFTKSKGATEVCPFWELEDIKKVSDGLSEKYQVAFWAGILLGRRVSDIMDLKWSDFYKPDGTRKTYLTIIEQKTGKNTNLFIPQMMFKYLENWRPQCNSDEDIFPSRGSDKTSGYRKAFTKAAKDAGIQYPVSTHSCRKTFGLWSRRLHPQDVNSMQILQKFFNHSNTNITSRYIGLDAEAERRYIEDMNTLMERVDSGETDFALDNRPVISLHSDDLRQLLSDACLMGQKANADADAEIHLENMNKLYKLAEEKAIGQDIM